MSSTKYLYLIVSGVFAAIIVAGMLIVGVTGTQNTGAPAPVSEHSVMTTPAGDPWSTPTNTP